MHASLINLFVYMLCCNPSALSRCDCQGRSIRENSLQSCLLRDSSLRRSTLRYLKQCDNLDTDFKIASTVLTHAREIRAELGCEGWNVHRGDRERSDCILRQTCRTLPCAGHKLRALSL
jgi:hypothetical protein